MTSSKSATASSTPWRPTYRTATRASRPRKSTFDHWTQQRVPPVAFSGAHRSTVSSDGHDGPKSSSTVLGCSAHRNSRRSGWGAEVLLQVRDRWRVVRGVVRVAQAGRRREASLVWSPRRAQSLASGRSLPFGGWWGYTERRRVARR